ncbi:phosphomannose isomerase type I, partial [Oesophagostomum dentatum]
VSPAVVIPALLEASKQGYGVQAGVPSLVIAAASLDDVYAITIFSLTLSLVFPTGDSPIFTVLGAPAEIFAGVFFGAVVGYVLHVVPRKDVQNLHLIRLSVLFSFSLAFLFGTAKLRVDGAGAIGVLVAAFVASHAWKKEGSLPEEDHLANMWHHALQPLLFGLIGLELNLEMISTRTVLLGVIILAIGLLFRLVASFVAVFGSGLHIKERLFVAIAWMPKATVQAALAPVVLEAARSRPSSSATYVEYGVLILTISIMSILITAPFGALAIRLATPVLLKKDEKSTQDGSKQYSWGRPGSSSTVAALVKEGHHADYIDENKPYAEFWMGVHPNGPAKLVETSEDLSNRIKNHPELVATHEKGTLQFLFKVLSVNQALSVQSHPTKEEAILLHKNDPAHYPDPNHKPEMAIALTDFELLCGFRPAKEIYENLKGAPEVMSLVDNSDELKNLLGDEAGAKAALK